MKHAYGILTVDHETGSLVVTDCPSLKFAENMSKLLGDSDGKFSRFVVVRELEEVDSK